MAGSRVAVSRCWWCGDDPEYQRYHDEEWGFVETDDHRLFELLSLEGFQSGLSWLTILRKRDNFRRAFANFDPAKVARFSEAKVERLLQDVGIVRHRGKIEAVIGNAGALLRLLQTEGSFREYVWRFEPAPAHRPTRMTREVLSKVTTCPESVALAKDLKRRGFRFCGPTTVYAFMQAVGLVNDHLEDCSFRAAAERSRKRITPPRSRGRARPR